jgi:hypothetical protein
MSFPKITNECIMAVLEKATQRDPYTYAAESLMNLIRDEQIALASAMTATAEGFAERLAEAIGGDDEQTEDFAQTLSVSIVATALMVYESMKAQHEAQELAEMFGENPE